MQKNLGQIQVQCEGDRNNIGRDIEFAFDANISVFFDKNNSIQLSGRLLLSCTHIRFIRWVNFHIYDPVHLSEANNLE